jgi:hypothetical protein
MAKDSNVIMFLIGGKQKLPRLTSQVCKSLFGLTINYRPSSSDFPNTIAGLEIGREWNKKTFPFNQRIL